jgi:hypothetical protein
MTERAIKANSSEAQQLYQRGVAAARGGQRRVAAGLLTRSVQLDPQSERAWLWLSGVLDDPEQIAFCLHAVLKLNPQNQHALKGLERLAARGYSTQARQPAPGLQLPSATTEPAPQARNGREAAHSAGDSWWVHWRRNRRETSRVRLLLWTMPLILVCLALVLYESFALAVDQAHTAAASAAVALVDAGATPPDEAEPAPFFAVADSILEAEPLAVVEGLTVAYLGAIEPMRAELRTATEAYRQATSQPGGASVSYVAATQRLRATVEQALATMEELRPPGTLQQAHDDYRRGLELELAGLDAVLSFYSSYDVANANRAAMHFQQARAYIERASGAFAVQRQQLADLSAMSAQTAR